MINLEIGDVFKNKKYIIIYAVFLLLFIVAFYNHNNFIRLKFDLLVLFILFIGGLFSIIYYSKTKNLHRSCFIILLIFGLIMCLTTPAFVVCDEIEHYARSDLTSQGILFPEHINNEGYGVSSGFNYLIQFRGYIIHNFDFFSSNVNNDYSLFNGCFPQNPFYPYLLSGLGIFITSLLNLNPAWSIYIGRILNILFYCAVCSFAVKKAPEYKLPILVVACIPLAVYQAASFSADGFLISVTLLAIAYYINIYKSDIVSNKDLGIFFALIFLVSLLKLPYVLLVFLIYFIKKDKFSSKNAYIISRIMPLIIVILCAVYSLNASKLLKNTIRNEHFIRNNVDPKNQLNNMINHPMDTLILFSSIFSLTLELCVDLFRFSYEMWIYTSHLLAGMYVAFFAFLSITYDSVKFKLKKREKYVLTFILLLIYLAIIFIQYLSWAPFAYPKLDMVVGVYARYYIPLLAFLPMIFNSKRINDILNIKDYNSIIISGVLIFLSGSIIFTLASFY